MPNTCTPSSTSSPACSPYLFPPVEAMLREAQDDLLAFTAFPIDHWKQIWSTNPLERLNKEIKRRTDVVGWGHLRLAGDLPNPGALLRLAGAVLVGATTNGR